MTHLPLKDRERARRRANWILLGLLGLAFFIFGALPIVFVLALRWAFYS